MSAPSQSSTANMAPTVSVVLPVYNGEPFLAEAIESILAQTFADFELVAIDDASKDNSRGRLDDIARRDSRVCVVEGLGRGLVDALNRGLARARGEFIARMDSDDVSLPDRFARQVEYLRAHPDVAVVGSTITLIDAGGAVIRDIDYPLAPAEVDRFLIERGCALAHPAVMARREAVLAVGGYRELFQHGEDYDLWLRMAERYLLANLPDRLLRYRHHDTKLSLRHATAQRLATHMAKLCAKARRSGRPDPLAGRPSLSLDDLARFDLKPSEREAIRRDVEGAPPLAQVPARPDIKTRSRLVAVGALRRILPAAWFERLRSLVVTQNSSSAH